MNSFIHNINQEKPEQWLSIYLLHLIYSIILLREQNPAAYGYNHCQIT